MADVDIDCIVDGTEGNGNMRVAESRSSMLAEIERNNRMQSQENNAAVENTVENTVENAMENAMENNALFDWQQRLAASAWAQRKPAWAERQIVDMCRNWAPSSMASLTRCSLGVSMKRTNQNNIQ